MLTQQLASELCAATCSAVYTAAAVAIVGARHAAAKQRRQRLPRWACVVRISPIRFRKCISRVPPSFMMALHSVRAVPLAFCVSLVRNFGSVRLGVASARACGVGRALPSEATTAAAAAAVAAGVGGPPAVAVAAASSVGGAKPAASIAASVGGYSGKRTAGDAADAKAPVKTPVDGATLRRMLMFARGVGDRARQRTAPPARTDTPPQERAGHSRVPSPQLALRRRYRLCSQPRSAR